MDLLEEIKSFKPIDIDKISQENDISQKVIDSVKSYNKAIENLRTGSEDIAIIELKKVVSSNPDFYEAINLLGLCYAYTKQIDKAEELFGRVVQNENDVIKAADYLKYIGKNDYSSAKSNSEKVRSKKTVTNTENKTNNKNITMKNGSMSEELPTEYLLFKKIGTLFKKPNVAIGFNIFSVLCLIAALIFFAYAVKGNKQVNTDLEPAINTQLNQEYEAVVSENKSLKQQLNDAEAKLKEIQLTSDISKVSTVYGQKKYVEAADLLLALPVDEMNTQQKKEYDSIKANVLTKAANQLANEGNTLFNAKKYSDAIKKLEKVFALGDKWTFGDKALYILAKSYVEVNDIQKGVAAYQKLIDEYPKSGYIKFAKSRLNAIQ